MSRHLRSVLKFAKRLRRLLDVVVRDDTHGGVAYDALGEHLDAVFYQAVISRMHDSQERERGQEGNLI